MADLDPASRVLGLILGLGDLQHDEPCHGYERACPCSECQARSEAVNPAFRDWLADDEGEMPPLVVCEAAKQPWQPKRAA